jgi:hypothetical protein
MAEEYPNYRRISDQAALLANIDYINEKYKSSFTEEGQFGRILKINSKEQDKEPEVSINSLYNFKDFIKASSKLTSADLSFLIPYIKIYKTLPNQEAKLIPFNNFYPKKAIESMTNSLSDRGFQANLSSVEIISQGKDTATTFLYGLKLKIVFDSIATLFTDNSPYLELFGSNKGTKGNINPDYFQIVLKFGWNASTIEAAKEMGINAKDISLFTSLSESSLVLHYIMHKINLNEDGSAVLDIEYNGALDSISKNGNEINILASQYIQKLQNLEKEITEIQNNIKNSGCKVEIENNTDNSVKEVKVVDKDGAEVKGTYDKQKENLKNKLNEQNKQVQAGKEEFLNSMINGISDCYLNGRMPSLSIDKSIYETLSKIINEKKGGDGEEGANTADQVKRTAQSLQASKLDLVSTTLGSAEKSISSTTEGRFAGASGDIEYFKDLTLQESKILGSDGKPATIPKYNIKFFTFGALMKHIKSIMTRSGNNVILAATSVPIAFFGDGSPVDKNTIIQNPNYQMLIDNGLDAKGNYFILKNKISKINIAEIPIALSTFKTWFLDNIVSQNLTNMTLSRFLDLCVNDLLKLALMPDNQDYIPKQNIKFKYMLDKVFFKDYGYSKINSSFKELENGNVSIIDLTRNTKNKDLNESLGYNVVLFYCTPLFVSRKANFEKDISQGVPHFFYGNSNGNIKKITFREETIPHFKEANIQAQVERTPWKPSIFLRGKYNVLIEMYGTVNYKMGSLIYVSPTFTGVMNKQTALEYGIGGYYVIVSIKHTIESGKYETTIEANWVARGDGKITNLHDIPYQVFKVGEKFQTDAAKLAEANKEYERGKAEKLQGFAPSNEIGPKY